MTEQKANPEQIGLHGLCGAQPDAYCCDGFMCCQQCNAQKPEYYRAKLDNGPAELVYLV